MEISSKRLERTAKLIYFFISLALCVFLILLSNQVIEDLDSAVDYPVESSFEDTQKLARIRAEIQPIDDSIKYYYTTLERIDKAIELANQTYSAEKQLYDNWLAARKTIGSPEQDNEVLTRAHKLDQCFAVRQAWEGQKNQINNKIAEYDIVRNNKIALRDVEIQKASALYSNALARYETLVFLLRLLLVAPILALGVFFFIRLRKHKFWPLFRGFSIFSLYVFFVGLVPYLPSYGGYIRYAVGVLLSVFAGYYSIKRLRLYMDKKRQELEISTQERARNVQSETAEKALNNHVCPSCGKDFVLRNWEVTPESLKSSVTVSEYCRYCGLELFAPCSQCGTVNYVHLPFCLKCGTRHKRVD